MSKPSEFSAADIAKKLKTKSAQAEELTLGDEKSESTLNTDEQPQVVAYADYAALEEKLAEAETATNDAKNQLLRNQAELENIRRRVEKDVANAHKYGLEKIVTELLTVVDNLERGLSIEVSDNEFAKRIHEGMEMTLNHLLKTLEKFAVKQVNPIGEIFNPEFHQAISMQETADASPNTVLQVLQKGYLLNDRLIRPALVVVSKG